MARPHIIAIAAAALVQLGATACDREEPEPPAPVNRVARPLEGVQIDARTQLREIEIEIERFEELKQDPEDAIIVDSRPELLDEVESMIRNARKTLDAKDKQAGREFELFQKQARGKLDEFEQRLSQLRKKTPASEDAGVSSD